MNTSLKTRKLAVTGILTAIAVILGLTPLGYIPIPPIEITLMAIPVLVGVLVEGLSTGLILGLVFGATSFLQIFLKTTPLSSLLFSVSPFRTILVVFIPRLLVPIIAWIVYKAVSGEDREPGKARSNTAYALSAFAGSITNTVFFLGMMYLLYQPQAAEIALIFGTTEAGLFGALSAVGAINGIPEAIVAVIIVSSVCIALRGVQKRIKRSQTNKEIS